MADASKVRLVRCPKCENVLAEVPNLAVYRCGGCGAVLQAKKQLISGDGVSLKSDEEGGLVSSGKLERKGEDGVSASISDSSEVSDRESNEVKNLVRKERRAGSSSSSSSRNENKIVNENTVEFRNDARSVQKEIGIGGKYRRRDRSKDPVDNWVIGKDKEMRDKTVKVDMQREIGELESQMGVGKRSRQFPYWRPEERDGSTAYKRTPRAVSEGVRFGNGSYPHEGPSSYHPSSSYGLSERLRNDHNSGGADRVEHLEQDRAELLRKLNELKDQLTRSCEVSEKVKERTMLGGRTAPVDSNGGHDTRFPEGPSRPNGPPVQPFPSDMHAQRPIYSNHGLEPIPLMRRGMDMQNFYPPPLHSSNEFPGFRDPFGPPVLGSNRPPHQYTQQSSNDYLTEQYMDMGPDHIGSYPNNTFFHQPACSCLRCYHNHLQVPPQVQPGGFNNRRYVDTSNNPMLYHLDSHGPFGSRGYNPIDANYPLVHSREPQPVIRRPRDLDSESGVFGQNNLRRVPLAKRNARRCFPVAGGAPFITCHNCFEVLPLHRNLLLKEKSQQKLLCGACSTIISFSVESNKIIFPLPAHNKEISSIANIDSVEVAREDTLNYNGHENQGDTYSDDYDSGFKYNSTVTEPVSSSIEQRQNLREPEKKQGSSRSTSSEDEESPDSVIVRKEAPNFAERPLDASVTPPLPGSPLHKSLENQSSDRAVSKFGKGNRSKHRNQEEAVAVFSKATSRQNSVKDVSVATEMEVSYNEYSNADMSQDSGEVNKEERPKIGKGGESFFVGLIKKGFRDLSRSHQMGENERPNVSVNGQPIPERLVKKAEKQAGPIRPGEYWYDFKAGFWGVMGHPCMGIIPPFIEEFNYPIPKNCAAGNTGVFVNGRELHLKDLTLLANRGLPTSRDKSYIIELSGRVVDEDSGEELDSLGKLAPTVKTASFIPVWGIWEAQCLSQKNLDEYRKFHHDVEHLKSAMLLWIPSLNLLELKR